MGFYQIALFGFNCTVAFLFVFGMFFIASGIVNQFLGSDSLSVRWSAVIVVGVWLASVGFHILAGLGILRVWAVAVGIVCLVGIILVKGYSFTMLFSSLRYDRSRLENFLLLETNPLQKCLLIILGIGALLVAGRGCMLPPLSSDTLTYHAVKAGMWVQSGNIGLMEAPGGWFYSRNFPGGGEALQALSMLPFHGGFLINLVDFVEWLSLIPALFLLGRCVGLERNNSIIGGLFCLFLPCVVFSVGSCFVDLLMALTLTLGVAFAAKFCLSHRKQYLVLGLMSLGIAGGVKFLAYPPICVVLVVIVLHIVLCRQLSIQTLLILGLAIILMLAPMVPWLFYNVPTCGHSFFPISLDVAGLKLSPSNPVTNWFLDRPEFIPYDLRREAVAFRRLFLWPWQNNYGWNIPNFGILSLLPFCIFPMAMISITRRQVWVSLLIVVVVGSVMGSYFCPGFTVLRQGWAGSNSRFLLGALFPVVVVSILVFQGAFRKRYVDFLLVGSVLNLIIVVRLEWQQFEVPYVVCAGVLFGLGCCAVFSLGSQRSTVKYVLKIIVVLLICWSGLYLARHHIRSEAMVRSYFIDRFPRYWVESVTWVDEPSVQRRIAVTSGPQQDTDNWFIYMFMGESLQNIIHYVPVTESGDIQHFGPWVIHWEQFSYESWLNRLHRQGMTHVMSFLPQSVEIFWMLGHPESFEQITGDNQAGLFRVKRQVDTDLFSELYPGIKDG